jgi:LuxR family maltose regulon positive regulatory protein
VFLQRLESYPDHAISSYLVEEILAQQAPAVQDFLVRTSILQQFCAELCAATIDSDAPHDQLQAILTWLEHANLFIIPLDERQGWYRYHPLIKQLLEQRLKEYSSPAAIARLHRRASAWYAHRGLIEEAIEHALAAGDVLGATQLVEARFLWAFEQEQWVQMERWLRLLPGEQIQSSPCLLFAQSWILQAHGRLNDLPRLLTAAEQLLARNESSASDLKDSRSRILHALLSVGWSMFQFFAGQAQESLVSACSALEWALPDQEFIASHALFFLALANQATGHEDVALLELNRGLREHSAHLYDTTRLLFAQAIVYLTAGKLQQVEQTARHLLRLSQQSDLALSQNWAHRFLGVVYYEWNNLDAAFYHFSAVIANQHHAHSWVVRDAMCGLALIYQAQGSTSKALETAHRLCELLQEQQNIHELQTVYAFCGRLALLQNDVGAAEQWLEMAGEQGMLGPMMFFEDPPITQAHLLLAKGDEQSVAQGQKLLNQLLQHVEATHNTRKTIKVLVMQAWAYDLQGRETKVLEVLELALSLSRPGGFIRTFADMPTLVKVLQELRRSRKAQQAVDKPLEAYLQRILVAMRPEAPPTNAEEALMQQEGLEPLTSRERQILHLLDRDLTNKEIARALVVTPGTVKVHTNSIYRKLCVNNRRAAITLSKALGLLVSDQVSSPPAI